MSTVFVCALSSFLSKFIVLYIHFIFLCFDLQNPFSSCLDLSMLFCYALCNSGLLSLQCVNYPF
jgi:hypothetical protein